MTGLLIQVLGLSCLVYMVSGQGRDIPSFLNISALNGAYLKETLPLGYDLGRIIATDPDYPNDDTGLTFSIRGDGFEYFNIDKSTGRVTLKTRLNFERQSQITSTIYVSDRDGQSNQKNCITNIIDENDELPVFTSTAINDRISEDKPIGFFVNFIEVLDLDSKNDILKVYCDAVTTLLFEACETFVLEQIVQGNKRWYGKLILNRTLDYEERKAYIVKLKAEDGVNTATNEIHITVTDVNDAPPVWEKTGPQVIDEEHPIGTPITTVTATDQDEEPKRAIFYELIGNFTDVFTIGNRSGVITNIKRLDFDSPTSRKDKPFDITIKAREIIPTGNGTFVLGNDPQTTSTIDIKITMRDINDNAPEFNKPSYTVFINEDIATGQNIPGLLMTVSDKDTTSKFNTFELTTDKYRDIFKIIPTIDSSSTSPTLQVIDSEKIDFDDPNGDKTYVIKVSATEIGTKELFSNLTTVTIKVRDVNDETPVFRQASYVTTLPETAPGGTNVIKVEATDREAGNLGQAGIRYKMFGNIPEHFTINDVTGQISVKNCATPGKSPCIDYEKRKQYTLTVSATDELGQGLSRSIQVTVNIIDENDNSPVMDSAYVRYIYEMQTVTINPLIIEAKDPDTVGGLVTYWIEGDQSNLWQITAQTRTVDGVTQQVANVTAKRPILYEDATIKDKGQFQFDVVASDTLDSTVASVTINVIDINNNAPKFLSPEYRVPLNESTPGDSLVLRVSARDFDLPTTDNGVIDFAIRTGGAGKFEMRNRRQDAIGGTFSVDIMTSPGAQFDFNKQRLYNLTLECRDRGTPQSLTGTASLIVDITDTNNVDPVITPTSTTINVREDTSIGTRVHKINAVDPDKDQVLRYFMAAQTATTPTGSRATVEFRNLFIVDEMTGWVTVNGALDRDLVAFIRNALTVEDRGSARVQTGTGALFIRITEFNDQDPYFVGGPYNVTLDEEKSLNSFVKNLECKDADDDIASYHITQTSPNFPQFFTLSPGSGTMIINERIDYEAVETIRLTATCVDSGQPARTATTTIVAHIRNINDNSPVFTPPEGYYRASIEERLNTTKKTFLIQVHANDIDKEDYGVVRYAIDQTLYPFFSVDAITGDVYILPGAHFDRETQPQYSLEVTAYDSPLDSSVRRFSTIPVYIEIIDVNDNCPEFLFTEYSTTVPESLEANTFIIDVPASDQDTGQNAQLVFAIQPGSGDPPGSEQLFKVRSLQNYGRVMTSMRLKDAVGVKRFNVTATDQGSPPCTTGVAVRIEIKESLNDAPKWIRPPRRDLVIYVLESQYRGMLVYSAKAEDINQGPNGVVDYFFLVNNQLVANTAEFRINRVTGVIRADVVFDREQKDIYFLTLMARDQGVPAASSETTLTVVILDVDDNDPKFRSRNGVVEPLILPEDGPLQETDGPRPLGNCSYLASDADSDTKNNQIFYRLLTNSQIIRDHIEVDRETCVIRLIKQVDYEQVPTLNFNILAYNEHTDDTVIRYKRDTHNPSILPVVVNVRDINDNSPVFSESTYLACASVDSPFRQTILQVMAKDPDLGDNANIRYSLRSFANVFGIDPILGTVYNKISFRYGSDGRRQFLLNLEATDGTNAATAKAVIFVTDNSNLVKLKVNRPRRDVEPFQKLLLSTIVSNSNSIDFACIDTVNNHATDAGEQSTTASDVYIMAARENNGVYSIIPAGDLSNLINGMMQSDGNILSDIYVTQAGTKDDSDDWDLEEKEVLAIFIICILLIILALILLCLFCYCIRSSKQKKVRKLNAERHTIVQVGQQPVETSVNPVYSMGSDNAEYATVQKRPQQPITPVVIPAPENLQPLSDAPSNLEPVEPQEPEEGPVPVIETEVLPDHDPSQEKVPAVFEHPEYEDKIETTVMDDDPQPPSPPPEPSFEEAPSQEPEPELPPPIDNDIEVEIKDNSPPGSPDSGRKGGD